MKLIIIDQISSQSPDISKIKESLAKIHSRGLKQRLKKKAIAAGVSLQ